MEIKGAGPQHVQMQMAAPGQGGLSALSRSVAWRPESRPHTNVVCRGLFVACATFYLVTTAVLLSAGKPKYDYAGSVPINWSGEFIEACQECCDNMFPDQEVYAWCGINTGDDNAQDLEGTYCWDWDVGAQLEKQIEDGDDDINVSGFSKPTSLWAGFGDHPYIPLVLVVALLVMATLWLVVLSKFAVTILWGTYAAIEVGLLYLMVGGENYILLPFALALLGYVVYARNKITEAGVITRQACTHILELPSLMAAIYAWLAVPSAIVLLLLLQVIFGAQVREVNYADCGVIEQNWPGQIIFLNSILFYWIWSTAGMVQVFMVAGCIGTQHFQANDAPPAMPLHFVQLAMWRNLGTVSLGAFFTAIGNYIERKVNCKGCSACWNILIFPIYFICLILYCCLKNLIDMLSHLTVIFHVITARPFWDSARDTQALMQTSGFSGVVLTSSTKLTFGIVKYCIAVLFGLASWAWMQDAYGVGIDELDSGLRTFMIIVMFLFMQNLWGTVFFIVVLAMTPIMTILDYFFNEEVMEGITSYLLGLFTGAICGLFFEQVCAAILAACETMFVAVAIERSTPHLNVAGEKSAFYQLITAQAELVHI